MNGLIVLLALASCAAASVAPYYYVLAPGQDTPEVAAAKANHFALYNQAAYAAAAAPDIDVHYDGYAHADYAHADYAPHTYTAAAPHHGYYGYIPTVTHDGFLLDTPDVAHAKAEFFHLYNEAAAAAAAAPDTDVHYDAAPVVHAPAPVEYAPAPVVHAYAPAVATYNHLTPAATHYTHLGPHYAPAAAAYSGYYAHGHAAAGAYVPADTPAVAHAKAEHFAAHAKALAATGH